MIKKLSNNKGVQESSTLTGIRELLREYRNKTNEIIDYLQAKEEVDKTWLKEIILKDKGIGEPNYEEASKGECKQHSCEFYKCPCILNPKTGICISKAWHGCNHLNPPEHEEEWKEYTDSSGNKGRIRVDPKKEVGEKDIEGTITYLANRSITGRDVMRVWHEVETYIKANFVSKEKIKREIMINKFKSHQNIWNAFDNLLDSLGLGD